MAQRLLRLLAGPELGLLSPLLFAGLYTWPLLTSDRPSKTAVFILVVWCLHVALLAATHYASNRLEAAGLASNEAPDAPAE
ncbi:MAG: hypothetical protein RL033_887 [Pseudomonadota bacterium]|jgi:hypothetical protein